MWVFCFLAALFLTSEVVYPSKRLQVLGRPRLNRAFDSDLWRAGRHNEARSQPNPRYGIRYEMVDDLLRSKQLEGVSEARCREALGAPDFIMDRKYVLAIPSYGGRRSQAEQAILESPQEIAYWSYFLAPQEKFPAWSRVPLGWDRSDDWTLVVEFRDGRILHMRVTF